MKEKVGIKVVDEAGKTYSVLIVDDESSNIMVLTHILSHEYTVYAAKNGMSAIKAVEKHAPDIVLLDIIMPEMDGYAVISALKSSEKTRDIPVIFISGLGNADDEEKGLALGASDYIAKPFSPAIVKLRVRNQIKMLAQLHTIERLSMTDQLTGLPNRRNFEARLNLEWDKARRERTPLSILIIDVDKFKDYNRMYGYQQGDAALQAASQLLVQMIRLPDGFAARWDGEEFVVLLPDTDSHDALGRAELIRKHIEKMDIFCDDGQRAKLTVSIGVNTLTPGHSCTKGSFVAMVDTMLYAAKAKGLNRVYHLTSCSG